MAREIERVCVEKIVGEMNELSSHGKSESSNTSEAESNSQFRFCYIILTSPRAALYVRSHSANLITWRAPPARL